ncbi:MAG: DUF1579 family protein [Pirellulaceae bacterium]
MIARILMAGVVGLTCGLELSLAQTQLSQEQALQLMQAEVGTWRGEMQDETEGSAENPEDFEVRIENEMLGELWLASDFSGSFDGHTQTGRAILRFDVEKQQFIRRWFDSDSEHMTKNIGTWDAETKTFTYLAHFPYQETDMQIKTVVQWPDNDTRVLTSYLRNSDDEEFVKSFHIVYRRELE